MYRTAAKAALTIAPAPLPAEEGARLRQLLREAFDLDRVISAMMSTVYSTYQQQQQQEKSTWQLWERMYRVSQRGHRRYMRRRTAMDVYEANTKALRS